VSVRTSIVAIGAVTAATLCFLTGNAQATALFTDRTQWENAVAAEGDHFADVNIAGDGQVSHDCDSQGNCTIVEVPSFTTPKGVTITQNDGFHREVVPTTWTTWSNGNTPFVLARFSDDDPNNLSAATVTLHLSSNVPAFGLEAEPDGDCDPAQQGCVITGTFDMTLKLSDGSSETQSVDANSGAKFFGWTDATDLTSVTVTCSPNLATNPATECFGFAFGRMVEAPEPASLPLFAGALIGFAFVVRRQHQQAKRRVH